MKKCWRTAPAARPNFTEMRRHLETMMEAAEPSLYLSLMADIPSDYFHLSSRSDLLEMNNSRRDGSTREKSPNRRRQNSYPYHGSSRGGTSRHRASEGGISQPLHSPVTRENCEQAELLPKNSKDVTHFNSVGNSCSNSFRLLPPKKLSLDFNSKIQRKSYLSPDSGIQRSDACLPEFCDQLSIGDDDAIELEFKEDDAENDNSDGLGECTKRDYFPMNSITVNNMTIIENKSYDLAD